MTENFQQPQQKSTSNYQYAVAVDGISGSGARQGHGIVYEHDVIERFNLNKSLSSTSLFDAHTQSGIPVSIKNNKAGTNYGLGGMLRQSLIDEPFILVAGCWRSSISRAKPEHEFIYFFDDPCVWRENFDENIINEYLELIISITNNKSDDEHWRENIDRLRLKWNFLFKKNPSIIPAPKRDHKNQKRLQCTMVPKNFYDFLVTNPKTVQELMM